MTRVTSLRLEAFGDPPLLDVVHTDLPALVQGEARLRLLAAEVLPLDVDIATGRVPAPVRNGLQPGTTAVAEIVEGPGAGDRVAVQGGAFGLGLLRPGTFAERFDAPTQALTAVPAGLATDVVAAGFTHLVAARLALHDVAQVRSGETVLVLGASGGVGRAAAAIALAAGAQVVTATRRGLRRDAVPGATSVAMVDLAAAVRDLTGGEGADVIVDPVGGDVTAEVATAGGDGCRHVLVGTVAGRELRLTPTPFLARQHRLLGLNALLASGGRLREVTEEAIDDLARGVGVPRIGATYDLTEAEAAYGQVGGTRILFVPDPRSRDT